MSGGCLQYVVEQDKRGYSYLPPGALDDHPFGMEHRYSHVAFVLGVFIDTLLLLRLSQDAVRVVALSRGGLLVDRVGRAVYRRTVGRWHKSHMGQESGMGRDEELG